MRHPFLRIDHFPALIEVARSGGNIRMLFRHALPRAWVAVLEREVLGVWAVTQNNGVQAVVHRDRYVPINPHTVANFRPLLQRRHHDLLTNTEHVMPRAWPSEGRRAFARLSRGIQYPQSSGLSKESTDLCNSSARAGFSGGPWPSSPTRRRRRRY